MSDQHACICEICRAVRRDLGITEKARADRLEKALRDLLEEQYECDQDNSHVAVWCITHQAKRCEMSSRILPQARRALEKPEP
jgi:hypothetical protein